MKIDSLADPRGCNSELVAALAALQNADAIVFDLRDAVGGHVGMVTLLVAHLFDERPQLSSLHWRERSQVDEFPLPVVEFSLAAKRVYVLTSQRTFSAAEWFAYDLQSLNRATIIGETTAGGAHTARLVRIDKRFQVNLPYARAVNPITGENWEGRGVVPDISVVESSALDTAVGLFRSEAR